MKNKQQKKLKQISDNSSSNLGDTGDVFVEISQLRRRLRSESPVAESGLRGGIGDGGLGEFGVPPYGVRYEW